MIKPPKGTNVDGVCGGFIKHLLDVKSLTDVNQLDEDKRCTFYLMMDKVVDSGVDFTELIEITDVSHALHYFCGYIARRCKSFTECENCISSLKSERNREDHNLITVRDQFGLTYPSNMLSQFVAAVEKVILEKVEDEIVQETPLLILEKLLEDRIEFPLLGCEDMEHKRILTFKILKFLLIIRLYFILKVVNKEGSRKTKKKRKESKL